MHPQPSLFPISLNLSPRYHPPAMSAHDFAPYQDSPERIRALSPPPKSPPPPPAGIRSPRQSLEHTRTRSANIGTAAVVSPKPQHAGGRAYFDEPSGWGGNNSSGNPGAGWGDEEDTPTAGVSGRTEEMNVFETRLPLRMDIEACLAYLVLPPAGAVGLLMVETQSDYVRFHAWQSSLLFSVVFIVHVIFSWSAIISWMLFVVDLGLIGYLTFRAYQDASTLDRFEVPFFGPLASSILDDE